MCQSGFNRAAAAAVCRQIGYVDASPVFPRGSYFGNPSLLKYDQDYKFYLWAFLHIIYLRCSTEAYPNSTRRLSHALCSNVSNYVEDGELHIMRCSVGSMMNTSCPLVAVECCKHNIITVNPPRHGISN